MQKQVTKNKKDAQIDKIPVTSYSRVILDGKSGNESF
jgi:hypothetical protein